jgi:maleate isomerase
MAEGITGWRLHIGAVFPTPVPPRFVREFYQVVPDGVDVTTVSLTIQQLADDDLDEALRGMERAAKQLANFDVDFVYQLGVPPIVRRERGFHKVLAERLSQASGLPAATDMSAVIEAMRHLGVSRLAMATPFEREMNERIRRYLAAEEIDIVHMDGLGIRRNTEIRRLPIPVEYQFARKTFREAPTRPEALYIPCGGWGSIHNIALLEKDLRVPVITWMNALVWYPMRQLEVAGPITGFGRLLGTL